jgi:mRNA-degrading endonuclease RelE of RelBE toxin-antitoxin system
MSVTYRILLSETAAKYLRQREEALRKRILGGLRALEEDPLQPRSGADIKRILGTSPQKYRLRVGEHRVVYLVEERDVKVIEIFRRGPGYR